MIKEIKECRISGDSNLIDILNLGTQSLTGIFPASKDEALAKAPLELVWSKKSKLLQLKHTYSLSMMYGDDYGYRSGLNESMVKHLRDKVGLLVKKTDLKANDLVVDIGSNDGTTLKSYERNDIIKVGIDPTGSKFKKYYTDDIELIEDFFPNDIFDKKYNDKKAKIITSIAMFYDLEKPLSFVEAISKKLDLDGIWHLEQSYLPLMLKAKSYDTVCHEHLEYYTLNNIKDLVEQCGMKIIDVETNKINGGSFAVTVCHKNSKSFTPNEKNISTFLKLEKDMSLDTIEPYLEFKESVFNHRKDLIKLVNSLKEKGKTIFGYGASTKGNVLLQFCNFNEKSINCIAEVNEDKFGCFTPGSNIPIISEAEALKLKPDYFLVLPWHFKEGIMKKNREFIRRGGKFIFPLPDIEIV